MRAASLKISLTTAMPRGRDVPDRCRHHPRRSTAPRTGARCGRRRSALERSRRDERMRSSRPGCRSGPLARRRLLIERSHAPAISASRLRVVAQRLLPASGPVLESPAATDLVAAHPTGLHEAAAESASPPTTSPGLAVRRRRIRTRSRSSRRRGRRSSCAGRRPRAGSHLREVVGGSASGAARWHQNQGNDRQHREVRDGGPAPARRRPARRGKAARSGGTRSPRAPPRSRAGRRRAPHRGVRSSA